MPSQTRRRHVLGLHLRHRLHVLVRHQQSSRPRQAGDMRAKSTALSCIVFIIVTLVQGTGSLEYVYTSPSSCDSDGELNPGTQIRSVCRRLTLLEPTKT
jgi:hypothetical protein